MVDQRLKIVPDRAEGARSDVERLTSDRRGEGADDGIDEVFDREQLIAIRTVTENRDASPFPNPVEQDLEDAEAFGPTNVFGRTITTSRPRRPNAPASRSASIFDSPYQPTPTNGSSSWIGWRSGTP